ncbi:hypothetical protein MYSTI_02691 [Myxococcus stipitatus DSM 14675]|uniref:Uncharacterized protein n=1 Tax=Myxococcus stipitatus (strain DSM 14675 / JCM 12634 / Mx s8) TaxID=1278073 RepID=L7U8X6_MYXSD|nr:AHH domain-containing protein [Myxococcus stipitatus]AGC44007.1 hypothetical protein MYSTI_02691 [Myxococcus stipitatus DSM 14675]
MDDWNCPFSHGKAGTVTNELDTDPAKLGTRMENGTSSRLWDDSSGKFEPKKISVDKQAASSAIQEPYEVYLALDHLGNSVRMPFSVAAHHLIPGEASLPQSRLIDYVKGGSVISSDIGYGVNGRENGIWLPTHHALSQNMPVLPSATKKHRYSALSKEGNREVASVVSLYTQAVMEKALVQFHDDHTQATGYSSFVVQILDKIQANLATIKNYNCSQCQKAKKNGGKLPPPYILVHRLNQVSSRLAGLLTGPAAGWRPPVYTSPHARAFANDSRQLSLRNRG